jgi:hypothetical protein
VTLLLLPATRQSDPETAADQKNSVPADLMEVEGEDADGSDSLAMRYAMRRYANAVKGAEGEEGGPLTTKAIRDYDKIQREVVYSQTLVKIRSPSPTSFSLS